MDHLTDPLTAGADVAWGFTHVVRSRGLLFLSGVTGAAGDGTVDLDPVAQLDRLFDHLEQYLRADGAGVEDLVEITTYHVGLHDHLAAFAEVKARRLVAPYPAWTAVGVAELAVPGALVELRAVAESPHQARG